MCFIKQLSNDWAVPFLSLAFCRQLKVPAAAWSPSSLPGLGHGLGRDGLTQKLSASLPLRTRRPHAWTFWVPLPQ